MLGAPAVALWASGATAATHLTSELWLVILSGLLFGVGPRVANGCTSGNGVCGISRLSPRGIGASAIYIGAGGLTVLVMRGLA